MPRGSGREAQDAKRSRAAATTKLKSRSQVAKLKLWSRGREASASQLRLCGLGFAASASRLGGFSFEALASRIQLRGLGFAASASAS